MTTNRFSALGEEPEAAAKTKPAQQAPAEKPAPRDRSAAKQPNARPLNAPGVVPQAAPEQRPRGGDRGDRELVATEKAAVAVGMAGATKRKRVGLAETIGTHQLLSPTQLWLRLQWLL
jgi:hypothetical protein